MSDSVQLRLIAETEADMREAISLVRRQLGELVAFNAPRQGRRKEWLAYGALQLYDTPDTAEAKFSAAQATMRLLRDHMEHP
jgi:hypothetical protein